MEGARPLLSELEQALEEAAVSNGARKAAKRGLNELKDGLGADAYWRQRTWKKVLVIFAGPRHEPPVRDRHLRGALRRRQRRLPARVFDGDGRAGRPRGSRRSPGGGDGPQARRPDPERQRRARHLSETYQP